MKDWGRGLCKALGKRLVELTGDVTPDLRALLAADVIVATPEKWDGISRAWHARGYVQQVALLVLDEIHLLGADRWARHSHRVASSAVACMSHACVPAHICQKTGDCECGHLQG